MRGLVGAPAGRHDEKSGPHLSEHTTDRAKRGTSIRPRSRLELVLALIGLAGLGASIVLGLVTLLGTPSRASIALGFYVAGLVGMMVVTAGSTMPPLVLWALRIIAPLSGAGVILLTGA